MTENTLQLATAGDDGTLGGEGGTPLNSAAVAGVAGGLAAWAPSTVYASGKQVSHGGQLYAALTGFTSGASFNSANWLLLGQTPSSVVSGGKLGAMEVSEDFSRYAVGAPSVAMLGQAYDIVSKEGVSTPAVVNGSGKFVTNSAGVAGRLATYIQIPLSRPGRRVGATLDFAAGTTTAGSAGVILWTAPVVDSYTVLPDSPCHFVVGPTSWSYGVWQSQVFTVVATAFWATPLTCDGTTRYSVDIQIDRAENIAYVVVVDNAGNVLLAQSVTHALIGALAGMYATIEHFLPATATDCSPEFTEFWADSQQPAPLVQAKAIIATSTVLAEALAAVRPNIVKWTTSDGATIAIPTTTTDIAEANILLNGVAPSPLGNPTVTIASPGVFTLAGSGLTVGDAVTFSTTGALPTGITAGTVYYVAVASDPTFQVAATVGGAAINTSGSQSGTHSVTMVSAYLPITTPLSGSGNVWVEISALLGGTNSTATAVDVYLALRIGATNKMLEKALIIGPDTATTPTVFGYAAPKLHIAALVSGLTFANGYNPGSTHNFHLGAKASASAIAVLRASAAASMSLVMKSTPIP